MLCVVHVVYIYGLCDVVCGVCVVCGSVCMYGGMSTCVCSTCISVWLCEWCVVYVNLCVCLCGM